MNGVNLPQRLRIPSHVMQFHCAQCGECCTNKWRIETDSISYDKLYKKFEELGRHNEFYDNIIHHTVIPQIRFLSNGKCPYLSNNQLCSIQLEFGEEYLLDICKTFPRRIFASENTLDFSLALACKAAVKTLQQEPIYMIETVWPIENQQTIPFSFIQPNTIASYSPTKPLLKHSELPYCVLEEQLLKIMQNRTYPVRQRLLIVGQLIKRLLSDDTVQNSNDIAEQLEIIVSNQQLINPVPNIECHLTHLFFLSNIFLRRFTSVNMSKLFKNILLALSSDKLHLLTSADEMIRAKVSPPSPSDYQQTLQQYYEPSRSMLEPLLENYMVNYILTKPFYLKTLYLAYYRMAFAHAAIIAFSIGYGVLTEQPVNQDLCLQAIYDVESIFYSLCFDSRATNFQAGQGCLQIVENAMALANI